MGLLFAPAPAFVSAIWPPAGLTLAAALHLGRHAWTVIWLVAFLSGSLAPIAAHVDWPVAAAVAAATASGSTLRALLGARFLRRAGGERPSLTHVRSVVALVLGAGLVACLVPALIGVSARRLAGLVDHTERFDVALSWWLADVVGVVVAGPVLLSPSKAAGPGRGGSGWRARCSPPWSCSWRPLW